MQRNSGLTTKYVELMYNQCANPGCADGMDIQGHHIIPVSNGGPDRYWNLVSLCRSCHMGKGNHSNWREHQLKLLTWKCNMELNMYGFTFDEEDEKFVDNLKKIGVKLNIDNIRHDCGNEPLKFIDDRVKWKYAGVYSDDIITNLLDSKLLRKLNLSFSDFINRDHVLKEIMDLQFPGDGEFIKIKPMLVFEKEYINRS